MTRLRQKPSFGKVILLACASIGIALAFGTRPTDAFPRYKDDNGTSGSYCSQCHGDFDGPVSQQGTIFPSGDKHEMHRGNSFMNADCDLCHTNGDSRNPFIGSSNGTNNNPGSGCVGCHGRDYSDVSALGDSGVGLRAHHVANGISMCGSCHPGDPAPKTEDVLPTYYNVLADSNVTDPCNLPGTFGENFSIGDLFGLDNDGDNFYDGLDDDCCVADCDLPRNGFVDVTDLLKVLADWGNAGTGCDTDYNGVIDVSDLLKILADWGMCS